MSESVLSIGELASRGGVTRDALRYYERLGIISPLRRTAGGSRLYAPSALDRLRFIKQAQSHGMTLAEIRELLRLDASRGTPCRQVHLLLRRKLTDLDARATQLQQFRRTLRGYLAQCERTLAASPDADCPVVVRLKKLEYDRKRKPC